jgi:hypothetical protein
MQGSAVMSAYLPIYLIAKLIDELLLSRCPLWSALQFISAVALQGLYFIFLITYLAPAVGAYLSCILSLYRSHMDVPSMSDTVVSADLSKNPKPPQP